MSAFVLGELRNPGNTPTAMEWLGLAFFPGGVMVGLIIAWWRELPGGILSILSLIGFYVWHVIESGRLAAGPFFVLLTTPALLFVVAALCRWCGAGGRTSRSPGPA